MFPAEIDHPPINLDHVDFLEAFVPDQLPDRATVSAPNHEGSLRELNRVKRDLYERLVIGMLVQLGELDVAVQEEDFAEDFGVVDVDRLEVSLLMGDVLLHRDAHGELVAANRESEMHEPSMECSN